MSLPATLKDNLTLKILAAAEEGSYGIVAQNCYDMQSVVALVRAAEKAKSPAMVQLFPGTMRQFGPLFVKFVIDHCHAASVPVSVQVDHAQEPEDIKWILEELAEKQNIKVDSIMIDASHADNDDENIKQAKPFVDKAVSLGIAVEVELGRIMGGESGIKTADEAVFTQPDKGKCRNLYPYVWTSSLTLSTVCSGPLPQRTRSTNARTMHWKPAWPLLRRPRLGIQARPAQRADKSSRVQDISARTPRLARDRHAPRSSLHRLPRARDSQG